MASVLIENLNKFYDNKIHAVKNANFKIKDKEFIVLVGPSGCGKSTLLRMLAGLEEISDGNIFIDDILVNEVSPRDRDVAMVFQNYALYPHMTVFENMSFSLKIRKFDKTEIHARVQKAAEMLGLQDLLDRKPKELSGGQRQRVAVGRAIVREPKVFLFDEPLSNLDAKLRVQMRIEINKLHRKLGATMIYVTHDQVEAMTMGDRIVVLKDGIIQQIDTPINLYNQPNSIFVAGFIGSPSMNFFKGGIVNTANGIHFRNDSMSLKLDQNIGIKLKEYTDITLGLRPEHISASDTDTKFKASIEVIEPMGSETFVYLNNEDANFTMRAAGDPSLKVGEDLYLFCKTEKMLFFDSSENRIML